MSRHAKTLDNGPFLLKQLISIPVFFYLANNVEECFAFNNTLPIIIAQLAKFLQKCAIYGSRICLPQRKKSKDFLIEHSAE